MCSWIRFLIDLEVSPIYSFHHKPYTGLNIRHLHSGSYQLCSWLFYSLLLSAFQICWCYTHTHTHTHACIYIYIYIYILGWPMSQPGFDHSFENLACLATLKSCETTKQSVCGCQYMFPYPCGVELSGERSNGCHLCKARLFEWVKLSVAVKRIYVNKKNKTNKSDT